MWHPFYSLLALYTKDLRVGQGMLHKSQSNGIRSCSPIYTNNYNKIERSQLILCMFCLSWLKESFIKFWYTVIPVTFCWTYITLEQLLPLSFISLKVFWHRNWVFNHLSLLLCSATLKVDVMFIFNNISSLPFCFHICSFSEVWGFGVFGGFCLLACPLVCFFVYCTMVEFSFTFLWEQFTILYSEKQFRMLNSLNKIPLFWKMKRPWGLPQFQ